MADHGEDYETGKGLKNARSPLSEGLPPPHASASFIMPRGGHSAEERTLMHRMQSNF